MQVLSQKPLEHPALLNEPFPTLRVVSRRKDASSVQFGELYGDGSHATGRCVNKNRVSTSRSPDMDQSIVCRDIVYRDGRRLSHSEVAGNRADESAVCRGVSGNAWGNSSHDVGIELDVRDVFSHIDDLACDFEAEVLIREYSGDGFFANVHDLLGIDRSGVDLNRHLARAWACGSLSSGNYLVQQAGRIWFERILSPAGRETLKILVGINSRDASDEPSMGA